MEFRSLTPRIGVHAPEKDWMHRPTAVKHFSTQITALFLLITTVAVMVEF
jgi:hypothetical protein